jgi:Ca-activated chloride channel family protein
MREQGHATTSTTGSRENHTLKAKFPASAALFLLSAASPFSVLLAAPQDAPVNIVSTTVSRRMERREVINPAFRLNVERVFVPVTVTDGNGHKVEGLQKSDFRIYHDGVLQPISDFFVDEAPVSVGIVLDASNSMKVRIDPARKALSALLRMSLSRDEFSLITVRDHPELVHSFTTRVEDIEHELTAVPTKGWTALYDGMYLGIRHAKKAGRDNRVLLVLSDGGDNNSRYTLSELRDLVRESDVRIFSISIEGRSGAIEKLAKESGGATVHVRKVEELSEVASSLSTLIHGEYVVGFSPEDLAHDGKYHVTKVEVVQPADGPRLSASWRRGFYAPAPAP